MILTNDEKQKLREEFAADSESILKKIDATKKKLDSKDWHFAQYLDFIKEDLKKFLINVKLK
jgi:two-component sensor histidine kinase